MIHNRYLTEIGLEEKEFQVNLCEDDTLHRNRIWEAQRALYGFDARETWNLNTTFVQWLYSHLRMYEEIACINLDYHQVSVAGRTYTQREAIKYIMLRLRYWLSEDHIVSKANDTMKKEINRPSPSTLLRWLEEATRMWQEILPYMWW